MDTVTRAANDMAAQTETAEPAAKDLSKSLRELRLAQRELIPPVVRVQMALHPWVAFGVMPLFALANAGVGLDGIDVADGASRSIMLGVLVALVLGKPLGVISASWLAVRVGLCRLPPGVSWSGVSLVGLLAGIGFTMSIFIANLAFTQDPLLGAAKLGVLAGSLASAVLGLTWGVAYARRLRS
jgi:NhaA family Na+:H+ antiporter